MENEEEGRKCKIEKKELFVFVLLQFYFCKIYSKLGDNIFIIDARMITLHCAILYPVFLR